MDRRHFLGTGAALAVAGAPLLDGVAHAATGAGRPARTVPGTAPRVPDTLPSRAAITAVLRKVADQWIAANPGTGDNLWANATFYSGLMALYGLTRDSRYLDRARSWAESHDYALSGGTSTRDADNQCAGQAYFDLYEAEPDPAKLTAVEACLHSMTYTDQVSKNDDWWWDDALHMAMPPFARLGALRGDTGYWTKMHSLYTHTKSAEGGPGLYVPATGLWYRDKNFLPGGILSPSGKPVVWSRGNGWVAGAHVKTLKALPAGRSDTAEYTDTLTRLVAAVARVQRSDGFWNVNLADPQHFPGPRPAAPSSSPTARPTPSPPGSSTGPRTFRSPRAPGTASSPRPCTPTACSGTCRRWATGPTPASRSPTTAPRTSASAASSSRARSSRASPPDAGRRPGAPAAAGSDRGGRGRCRGRGCCPALPGRQKGEQDARHLFDG